jgi:Flp pilus assembly protein TadG
MGRHTSRGWRNQRGESLLETAMMLTAIFFVVFWVHEVAWVMYTYSVLADAANEGVRYAVVHSGGDASGTQNTVKTFAGTSLHNISAISTLVAFPDGSAVPPRRVKVTVTYTYVPLLKWVMKVPPTMRTYAEGRMVVE